MHWHAYFCVIPKYCWSNSPPKSNLLIDFNHTVWPSESTWRGSLSPHIRQRFTRCQGVSRGCSGAGHVTFYPPRPPRSLDSNIKCPDSQDVLQYLLLSTCNLDRGTLAAKCMVQFLSKKLKTIITMEAWDPLWAWMHVLLFKDRDNLQGI